MPTKEEIENYQELLNSVYRNLGIGAVIFLIILFLILYFGHIYILKQIDKTIEETSEKTLKKYQANLDKENFKFETMHQNQIDAIHKVYKEFNELNVAINFLLNGENFSNPENPHDLISYIIQLRHQFKKEFLRNKLLFSKELVTKIDSLIPEVDKFIHTFQSGLFPQMSDEQNEANAEMNNGLIIAGIWSGNTFEPLLESMSSITTDIEDEFRKIVGTN